MESVHPLKRLVLIVAPGFPALAQTPLPHFEISDSCIIWWNEATLYVLLRVGCFLLLWGLPRMEELVSSFSLSRVNRWVIIVHKPLGWEVIILLTIWRVRVGVWFWAGCRFSLLFPEYHRLKVKLTESVGVVHNFPRMLICLACQIQGQVMAISLRQYCANLQWEFA